MPNGCLTRQMNNRQATGVDIDQTRTCMCAHFYAEYCTHAHTFALTVAEFRFGEVVSLACDMVRSGHAPNLNTYRILINACQRADQAQLAIEVYATMRAKKIPILQEVCV